MALALELGLDAVADGVVRRLWTRLDEAGVPSLATHLTAIRPHVSLLVSDDAERLRAAAESLRSLVSPVAARLVGPAFFPAQPAILYLAVTPADALVALHRRVFAATAEQGLDVWPHYRPGEWVPHCALSMGVAERSLGAAVTVCMEQPLPIEARLGDPRLTDSRSGATVAL
jgi:hypothetical protein